LNKSTNYYIQFIGMTDKAVLMNASILNLV